MLERKWRIAVKIGQIRWHILEIAFGGAVRRWSSWRVCISMAFASVSQSHTFSVWHSHKDPSNLHVHNNCIRHVFLPIQIVLDVEDDGDVFVIVYYYYAQRFDGSVDTRQGSHTYTHTSKCRWRARAEWLKVTRSMFASPHSELCTCLRILFQSIPFAMTTILKWRAAGCAFCHHHFDSHFTQRQITNTKL